jgi:hypothetical protein
MGFIDDDQVKERNIAGGMVLQLPHEPLTRRMDLIVFVELTAPKPLQATNSHKRVQGIA